MKKINQIITPCDVSRGAPMGRNNTIYPNKHNIVRCDENKVVLIDLESCTHQRLFDCAVPMDGQGYDAGGAYFGIGAQLRVTYNSDLTYVHFYRLGDDGDFRKQEIEEPTKFAIRYNKEYNVVEGISYDKTNYTHMSVSQKEGHNEFRDRGYYYENTKPADEEQTKKCYRFLVGLGYFPIIVKKLKF